MSEAGVKPGVFERTTEPENPLLRVWDSRLGLSLFLLMLVAVLSVVPIVRDSELRVIDTFFRLARPPAQHSAVVLVLIDDESLRQYGRWPWSREVLARLLSKIADSGAGVIGLDVLLSEPQAPEADAALQQSLQMNGRTVIVGKVSAFANGPHWVEPLPASHKLQWQ